MAFFLAPIVNTQQFDANGNPLVSGQILSYLAGTTTPTPTYTDSTGITQQTNPIILNTLGVPASPIWLANGVAYKFVIKDSLSNILRTIDNVSGINDTVTIQSQWVESGYSPTFVGGTSFSVSGDQTPTLQPGRRLRTTNTAGILYSTIVSASYGAPNTTVVVVNDSTALDSGLSAVSYGVISSADTSQVPPNRAYAEYTANADLTNVIPNDDTIPQIGEGTQILSVSLTPRKTTNRVRIRFQGETSLSVVPASVICSLFVNGVANAIAANVVTHITANYAVLLALEFEHVPNSLAVQTYTLNIGPEAAGTLRLNGTSTGRLLGGASRATLIAEEIPV